MNKTYDTIIYIGRFQPAHNAHITTIMRALELGQKLIILIGSANQPRTIKNPWSWHERGEMILASIPAECLMNIEILPIHDVMYNDSAWVEQIQTIVQPHIDNSGKNAIIGHAKDESSYYLKMFPQWESIEIDIIDDLHATDIRNALFKQDHFEDNIGRHLPVGIHDYLLSFMLTPDYEKLVHEFEFQEYHDRMWDMDKMLDYFMKQEGHRFKGDGEMAVRSAVDLLRTKYRVAPYTVTFNTVDVCIIQSGHILLVRRRAEPGKNLYALPGGYLNHNEWSVNGALRELKEETGIKVPIPVLKGSIKANKIYEHPERSIRGRIITHVYGIQLEDGPLPKVRGGDDASKATWVPLNVFEKMENQMFEDHFSIITNMINIL